MEHIKTFESYNKTENNQEFNYKMLDRLKMDCEYFIGNGQRHIKHLYYNSVEEHISEMKKLWNSLDKKPEWISYEDIEKYEKEMTF